MLHHKQPQCSRVLLYSLGTASVLSGCFSQAGCTPFYALYGKLQGTVFEAPLLSSAAMISIESKGNYSISVAVSGTTWFMHLSLRKHVLL